MIMDIREFYKRVDELVKTWELGNFKDFGKRLKEAKSYNFTASEILGEISIVLKDFQHNQQSSMQFESEINQLLEFIQLAFNKPVDMGSRN